MYCLLFQEIDLGLRTWLAFLGAHVSPKTRGHRHQSGKLVSELVVSPQRKRRETLTGSPLRERPQCHHLWVPNSHPVPGTEEAPSNIDGGGRERRGRREGGGREAEGEREGAESKGGKGKEGRGRRKAEGGRKGNLGDKNPDKQSEPQTPVARVKEGQQLTPLVSSI